MTPDPPHVVLVGLMGSGKTTLAGALSQRLSRPTRDSDDDIRQLWNCTGAELVERHGVPRLHEIERGLLLGALASRDPTIIAAAASTVDDELCRQAMGRRGFVVLLQAPASVLLARTRAADHRRPLDPDAFNTLAARRAEPFASVADLVVDTQRPISEVVAVIEAAAPHTNQAS